MSSCKRCGECCRLGGPVLHGEDRSLLDRFEAPSKERPFGIADLVTLRKGELVRDDVLGTLLPLEEECVKIAPAEGRTDWQCRFLVSMPGLPGREAGCGIYDRRPAQCRALDCGDTGAIAKLYGHDRITRTDLLKAVAAPEEWTGLFPAYEETCSYARIAPLAKLVLPPLNPGSPAEKEATEALLETVRFDISFRKLCVERGGIDPHLLPFLLGRPLSETLIMFGLSLVWNASGMSFVRKGGQDDGPVFPDGLDLYK